MNKKTLISFLVLFSLMINPAFSHNSKVDDLELLEEATTYYNQAIDFYKQDDVDRSIDYFEKAIKIKPDFYEAHYNISQILMSLNKNDEALKSLEEIAKIKPYDTENLYNLGKTYYKKGLLSKAYASLKAIDVNAAQYDSAKLILEKIEQRQSELNLEEKINARQESLDERGVPQPITLGEFSAPSGVAIDSRGNIFVASFLENRIYKISIYGQKEPLAKSNLIQGPIGIAMDKNDNIYVANYSANNIIKITPEGAPSIFAEIKKPYCITYDANHNRLYITEQETNKLIKIDLR